MPKDPRRELGLLRDHTGPLGFLLWRIISDLLLWIRCPADLRSELFRPVREDQSEALAFAALAAPEIKDSLRVLLTVAVYPELARTDGIADACTVIAMWAETQEMKETAVQFAEAAARVEPDTSARAYAAGRLCRRLGDYQRSAMWFRRAMRLARRTQSEGLRFSEVDFANAHRGYGFLLADFGRFAEAEPHFWKSVKAALRAGRKSLAGAAYHDLLLVAVHLGRWSDALEYAKQAVELYRDGHPRFPLLGFDIAFMWCRRGYHSSALPIFEGILPWVQHQRERILVLASMARSAAAVRDHIRYSRVAREVLALAAVDTEMAASSLYHIAEGARCFQDWEHAKRLATRAFDLATARKNATVIELAGHLLNCLERRQPGDADEVPTQDNIVDVIRELFLRKIQKQPAPELLSGAVPPEQYPTT